MGDVDSRAAERLGMTAAARRSWLALATSRSVVLRGLFMAALVGLLLIAINHGDALLHGDVDGRRLFKMALTLLVPYCVSTYSSVGAMRKLQPGGEV